MAAVDDKGFARVAAKERSNQAGGRSDSGIMKKPGPAAGGSKAGNPTKGGGINRPTRG